MDLKLIENLLNLISDSEVNEVSIEEGDFKIKVKKKSEDQQVTYTAIPQPQAQPSAAAPAPAASSPAAENSSADTGTSSGGHTITSPIVGTFYRSPSPDSDPFVNVGDRIEKGQVICIIEAMKIMNEIEADVSGVVKEIKAADAQPVEFDQPLFIIE